MNVVFCELRCGIEVSLAECGPSAAATIFYQRHFESQRFQHFDRCDPNVRFVIAREGVVPENYAAPPVAGVGDPGSRARNGHPWKAGVTAPGYSMSSEPFVEAFPRVMGQ